MDEHDDAYEPGRSGFLKVLRPEPIEVRDLRLARGVLSRAVVELGSIDLVGLDAIAFALSKLNPDLSWTVFESCRKIAAARAILAESLPQDLEAADVWAHRSSISA